MLVAYRTYRSVQQFVADGRFSDAVRKDRVKDLADRVVDACLPGWRKEKVGGQGHVSDYLRLCNEVMQLMIDHELEPDKASPKKGILNNVISSTAQ